MGRGVAVYSLMPPDPRRRRSARDLDLDSQRRGLPDARSVDGGLSSTVSRLVREVDSYDIGSTFVVVEAGSDLSASRPTGADVVYWKFSNGVEVGVAGANIVNGRSGDLWFVNDEGPSL